MRYNNIRFKLLRNIILFWYGNILSKSHNITQNNIQGKIIFEFVMISYYTKRLSFYYELKATLTHLVRICLSWLSLMYAFLFWQRHRTLLLKVTDVKSFGNIPEFMKKNAWSMIVIIIQNELRLETCVVKVTYA